MQVSEDSDDEAGEDEIEGYDSQEEEKVMPPQKGAENNGGTSHHQKFGYEFSEGGSSDSE